jgi:endonuclease G
MPYDPGFIHGFTVPLPTLGARAAQGVFNNGTPIHHTRFSIVFSQSRGFAVYTAHNLDGATILAAGTIPRVDRFRLDPNVPSQFQVDNDRGYRNNPWDRGHLVQRSALHWGVSTEAQRADSDSYFWTNIVPQHETLHDTAWGEIEDWMLTYTDAANQGAAVFTGPVLLPEDPQVQNRPGEDPIQLPSGFWKIVAIRSASQLVAAGFLVWQRDFDRPNPVEFAPFLEQVRITTLEFITGLSFGELRNVDPLRFGTEPQPGPARPGAAPVHAHPRPTTRAAVVTSPDDIYLGR